MGYESVIAANWAFAADAMMGTPASEVKREIASARAPVAGSGGVAVSKPSLSTDTGKLAQDRLAALVERMAAGDQQALADFYDASVGKAYGLTMRIVRNAALAEEVVSDAYYQVWHDAHHYDRGRGAVLTWLLMICRSRALDALRARDTAVPHEAPETLIPDADLQSDEDPLDLLAATEARQALREALSSLSPSQRQMLGLAFFRGLSHQQIAAQTHLPLGTVKSQIRRSLVTLRAALTAEQ